MSKLKDQNISVGIFNLGDEWFVRVEKDTIQTLGLYHTTETFKSITLAIESAQNHMRDNWDVDVTIYS